MKKTNCRKKGDAYATNQSGVIKAPSAIKGQPTADKTTGYDLRSGKTKK